LFPAALANKQIQAQRFHPVRGFGQDSKNGKCRLEKMKLPSCFINGVSCSSCRALHYHSSTFFERSHKLQSNFEEVEEASDDNQVQDSRTGNIHAS
jgi:hypothetical protein